MRWAEIKAIVADEASDMVANILIEEGCGGVAVTGPSVRASGPAELAEDLPTEEYATLTAYLPVDDRLEARLRNARDRIRMLPEVGVDISPGEITVKPVDAADWATAWKSFFKPLAVGKVFIKPSWEDVETRPDQIVVEIDPGMAFGTGNHPTTQLCLLALQKYVKGGESVLDVGSGSGILSIAAARLGAAELAATENDPVAVESAIENMRHNGVDDRIKVYQTETPSTVPGQFDIVVANITANVILALADDLAAKVKDNGLLIASGVIEARANEIVNCLNDRRFKVIEMDIDDQWVALMMRKHVG
jgi:ribosomal protein L11 methyltransferase